MPGIFIMPGIFQNAGHFSGMPGIFPGMPGIFSRMPGILEEMPGIFPGMPGIFGVFQKCRAFHFPRGIPVGRKIQIGGYSDQ